MIIKTRDFQVLEGEDIEQAVSAYYGKDYSLADMKVVLTDDVYFEYTSFSIFIEGEDTANEGGMYIFEEGALDEGGLASFELWPELGKYPLCLPKEYIFAFDTDLFGSYSEKINMFI